MLVVLVYRLLVASFLVCRATTFSLDSILFTCTSPVCHHIPTLPSRRGTSNLQLSVSKSNGYILGEKEETSGLSEKNPLPQSAKGPSDDEEPSQVISSPAAKFDEFEQKIESIKAAVLCGSVGSVSRLLAVGIGTLPLVPPPLMEVLGVPEPGIAALLFCLGAGALDGALFGLTYRYVVRSDRSMKVKKGSQSGVPGGMGGLNVDQLGDGCVGAFAFTSALGQCEVPLTAAAAALADSLGHGAGPFGALVAGAVPALPFIPRLGGNLFLFSAARVALDRSMDEGLIKPFPISCP